MKLIMIKRILLIVFDGLGIGSYEKKGNVEHNSLGHVMEKIDDIKIPTLCRWGIGNLIHVDKYKVDKYSALIGRTRQQSVFCDSFAAHWEMAGCIVNKGFTFSKGVPTNLIEKFEKEAGCKVIGNLTCYEDMSKIDEKILNEHFSTSNPILLTIPTEEPISTFAIVGNEKVIPHKKLFEIGEKAKIVFQNCPEVGRIVAKSFSYENKHIELLPYRFDIANFNPPKPNILDSILKSKRTTMATGKIGGLFNDYGFTKSITDWNTESIWRDTIKLWDNTENGLVWANLNSLDRPFGHNKDVKNWAKFLERSDYWLSCIEKKITSDDLLIVTGDHGCDPVTVGEHTKEWNPLIIVNPEITPSYIGDWNHIDIAKTISELWNLDFECEGKSFKKEL